MTTHLKGDVPSQTAAVVFDTNALKHLRRDAAAASDVLVYLESESIPVIIPGQVSQEFWNNHAAFVTDIEQLVGSLDGIIKKLDRFKGAEDPSARLSKTRDEIAAITADFQDVQNPNVLSESLSLWEKLLTLSTVHFVPRESFAEVGRIRFETKIPPGFADDKRLPTS
ncbi:MAG: PIN-like domain-containing protein [Actinomycetota bacterium]